MPDIDSAAKIVWDYLRLGQKVKNSDCLLVLGSYDDRVALRAAELFHQGMAPYLVFTGGFGRHTSGRTKPEADTFAKEAMKVGVPEDKIYIENRATNTGENVRFSLALLEEKGLFPKSILVITKPYMERRAFATFKKIVPDKEITVTSPKFMFEDAPYGKFSKNDIIAILMGDLQRILIYHQLGYQIFQEVPIDVMRAYEYLKDKGYTKEFV